MSWSSTFAIFRPVPDSTLAEVFHTDDMKKAKYWLAYIGKVGDVLCKTPQHPKHSHTSSLPEYWSHKQEAGSTSVREDEWRKIVASLGGKIEFPDHQTSAAEAAPAGAS